MAKGKKTGGRVAGTPNLTSAAVKDAIVNAFTTVGGEKYLVAVAKDDPKTFCALLGRVLPKDINATIDLKPLVKRINLAGSVE
jgi:hypothetical protein